ELSDLGARWCAPRGVEVLKDIHLQLFGTLISLSRILGERLLNDRVYLFRNRGIQGARWVEFTKPNELQTLQIRAPLKRSKPRHQLVERDPGAKHVAACVEWAPRGLLRAHVA